MADHHPTIVHAKDVQPTRPRRGNEATFSGKPPQSRDLSVGRDLSRWANSATVRRWSKAVHITQSKCRSAKPKLVVVLLTFFVRTIEVFFDQMFDIDVIDVGSVEICL